MNDAMRQPGRSDHAAVTLAYQPIIQGYFAVAAAYYAVMTITHVWSMSGTSRILMVCVASVACIASLIAWARVRENLSLGKLEIVISTINLLVLANVLVALEVEFNQLKLVYFIMMAMIFAFASVSMRQALVSIAVTLAGLFFEVAIHDPSNLAMYSFVGFAAAISAVAIAYFLRRAIGVSIAERQQADKAKDYAEGRLARAIRLSEEMRLQSMTDVLTGLPNRRGFFANLGEGKSEARQSKSAWLMLLDLDGFKAVNDNYGHGMGDELLKEVAARLADYCGNRAHASRVGGDEFCITYIGKEHAEGVECWCEKLLETLAQTYQIDGRLIQISGSMGCCVISTEESDAELLQKADFALIHAKRTGKNRVAMFDGARAADAAEHFRIERALREADFEAEIELVFQPQFDLAKQTFVGAEALARWRSPEIGKVGPERFIRIAEETGLIANITTTVLKKAIKALKEWDDPLPLSINLSAYDLNSNQTIDELIERLQASQVPADLIEFEITETAMMADAARASANLVRLSSRGHSIALDDFGTGYSNFNYLRTLPIDKLKVDRSFLENQTDPMTERVLRSLMGMARTLDVPCLLEGIESELDLVLAKRAGAHLVQGFLFGRPMALDDLRSHTASPRFGERSA